MSERNAQIVRDMYEAFNRGDFTASTEALHPDAELHQLPGMPDPASYYGRDEFVKGLVRWLREWDGLRFEPQEVTEAGDQVIVRVHMSGRGRASGVESTAEVFHV